MAKRKEPKNSPSENMATHSDRMKSEIARIGIFLARTRSSVGPKIDEVREVWNERAAMREYLAGVPREHAERMAIIDTYHVFGVRT